MKYSANCEKKTGLLGGDYYELSIKVVLTEEEDQAVRKFKYRHSSIVGQTFSDEEANIIEHFTTFSTALKSFSTAFQGDPKRLLRVSDLTEGIILKAHNETELPLLVRIGELIRERCKEFKERLQSQQDESTLLRDAFDKKGGAGFEEEF